MFLIQQVKVNANHLICHISPEEEFPEKWVSGLHSEPIELAWHAGVYEHMPVIVIELTTRRYEVHFALRDSFWDQLQENYQSLEIRWGDQIDDIHKSLRIDWDPHKFRRFLEDCYLTYTDEDTDRLKKTVLQQIVNHFYQMDPDEETGGLFHKDEPGTYLH
ncbi:MAG: hypothetical protein H0Z33_10820 [Bacillaceae bacterium]|nr:hypothetical protein [Bacillaceae bacterium]